MAQCRQGPLHLIGLDLSLSIADIPNGVAQGQIDLTGAATSADAAGDAWTPLDLESLGGRWIQDQGGNRQPFEPAPGPRDHAARRLAVPVLSLQLGADGAARRIRRPSRPLVDQAFLDRTGARIGDALRASVLGVPVTLDLLARVDAFPPLDQTKPFVIVDALAMDLARAGVGGSIVDTDEWWLSVAPGEGEAVASALRSAPLSADDVVDKTAVTADLAGDPLGLGVIGILGLGSFAALVFASIGFLVSATVSISERIGEFALLKALGLAPRQLLLWLSIENVMLLATGLILGTLLGLLLAYLVLPFATLTPTGEPPVPAPVIVVPPEAAVPTIALAALARARDGGPGGPPAALGADERRPPGEGRVAMRWTWMALKRIGDDRGATVGFAVLVLVTALLAALAPRVLSSLADEAVRAEVRNAPVVGPQHGAAPEPRLRRRPGGRPARADAGTPATSCSTRSRPRSRASSRIATSWSRAAATASRSRPPTRPSSGSASRRGSPTTSDTWRAGPPTSTVTTRDDVGPESVDHVPVYETAISTDTAAAVRDRAGRDRAADRRPGRPADRAHGTRTSTRSRRSPGSTRRSIPTRTTGSAIRS